LFFAWFNAGSNQVRLGNYTAAASAYDQAFAVYAQLPEEERPWRMMWYQHGPYPAYFDQRRYQDIMALASQTLTLSVEPALEESFYWRAQANYALGDAASAAEDLQQALKWHPDWSLALAELSKIATAP
jgi:tetratricopeptide (TPR) repeat protein